VPVSVKKKSGRVDLTKYDVRKKRKEGARAGHNFLSIFLVGSYGTNVEKVMIVWLGLREKKGKGVQKKKTLQRGHSTQATIESGKSHDKLGRSAV